MIIPSYREMRVIQRALLDPPSNSGSALQVHNGAIIPLELIQRYAGIVVFRFWLRFPIEQGFVEVTPRVTDFQTEVLRQPFTPVSFRLQQESKSTPAYLARTTEQAPLTAGTKLIFFADMAGKNLIASFPIVCRRLPYNL